MKSDEKEEILSLVDYLVTQQTRNLMPYDEAERIWNNLLTNALRETIAEGLAISLSGLIGRAANSPVEHTKIQTLPYDSNTFLVVSVQGTHSEEEQQEIVNAFKSRRLHGCVFFNREVDIHAIQITKHSHQKLVDERQHQAGSNA